SANCTVRAGTVVLTKRPTDGANNCRTGTPKCVRLNKLKNSVRTSRLRSSIKRKSLLTAKTITVTPGARNVLRPHRTVYVAGSDKHTLALKRCRKLVTQRSFVCFAHTNQRIQPICQISIKIDIDGGNNGERLACLKRDESGELPPTKHFTPAKELLRLPSFIQQIHRLGSRSAESEP